MIFLYFSLSQNHEYFVKDVYMFTEMVTCEMNVQISISRCGVINESGVKLSIEAGNALYHQEILQLIFNDCPVNCE